LQQAAAVGKPLLVEEAGITAGGAGAGCATRAQRAAEFAAKLTAQRHSGAAGYLPWTWSPTAGTACSDAIAPGDPVYGVLAAAAR
jgi:hypothetical protein